MGISVKKIGPRDQEPKGLAFVKEGLTGLPKSFLGKAFTQKRLNRVKNLALKLAWGNFGTFLPKKKVLPKNGQIKCLKEN